MLPIRRDSSDQPYIEWENAPGDGRRAWIRYAKPGKDYAGTVRYLSVVRIEPDKSGIQGSPTDFPIYSEALSDEQILESFVSFICSLTANPLRESDRG